MKETNLGVPETTHMFQIDILGSVTNIRHLGDFTCKIPNIKEQCLIGLEEAKLNGQFPENLNGGILKIHKQIAYLKYTLTEVPSFWSKSEFGYALRDPNVIEAVYTEVLTFENKWFSKIWNIQEENEPSEN